MPSYEGEPNHSTHKRSLSRVVSRETSKPNSSCRVYYGEAAGAVPFLWESHPGTPKHPLFDQPSSLIPSLTPPPSYAAGASGSGGSVGGSGKRRDFKPRLDLFVSSILTRASRSRTRGGSFSSSSSASWSSHGSARDGYSGEIPARSMRSPTSTLCFPSVKRSAWKMVSGCYTASMNVKNAGKIRA